jgi:hypothetical protein
MQMLSDDDLDLRGMTDEELDAAWDPWFTLAQATNDDDPPYTHGVFVLCAPASPAEGNEPERPAGPPNPPTSARAR